MMAEMRFVMVVAMSLVVYSCLREPFDSLSSSSSSLFETDYASEVFKHLLYEINRNRNIISFTLKILLERLKS